MIIRTTFATVEWTEEGCVSRFQDGTSWGAFPHDAPHYRETTKRLGYGDDTLTYCRHHEIAHHLVAEHFGHPSRVLWPLAHGCLPRALETAGEEALAMALQRFVRRGEEPFVDRVDWRALRDRFNQLMEARNAG